MRNTGSPAPASGPVTRLGPIRLSPETPRSKRPLKQTHAAFAERRRRSNVLSVLIDWDTHDNLRRRAKAQGVSVSSLIKAAIKSYLRHIPDTRAFEDPPLWPVE